MQQIVAILAMTLSILLATLPARATDMMPTDMTAVTLQMDGDMHADARDPGCPDMSMSGLHAGAACRIVCLAGCAIAAQPLNVEIAAAAVSALDMAEPDRHGPGRNPETALRPPNSLAG